jgi:aminoglycoside phosphotransferase (APT) family kinase protein
LTIAGPPEVSREIEEALARHGVRPRRVELVSPLEERKGIRFAYRVDNEDGHTVKLRHLVTSEEARRHLELRTGLEPAFAPAIARYGSVIVEEWVEGGPLTGLDAAGRAEEAGALLGRLHARPLESGVPSMISTAKWREGTESDLGMLTGPGNLTVAEAARLRVELRERDPRTSRVALVHLDFCADNMLIDLRGRLRVIDNELLAIRPAGLDLGRTFHLWPMPQDAWTCFFRGYRSAAPAGLEPTGYWRIVATLTGARVFLQRSPVRLDAALALLRRFAEGEGLSDPPLR